MTTEKLILLVGSNPLPNYLTARILKPQEVWLVYSHDTQPVKERLRKVLEGRLHINCENVRLEDAADAEEIHRRVKEKLPQNAHLNYTGGTKVMASHTYMAWLESRHGSPEMASYLDDGKEVLRFDNGWEEKLSECDIKLDLQTLADLEGLQNLQCRERKEGEPTENDAKAMAQRVLNAGSNKGRHNLTERFRKRFGWSKSNKNKRLQELRDNPSRLVEEFGVNLSTDSIPESDWGDERVLMWAKFMAGGWLEDWVADCIRNMGLEAQVHVGVEAVRSTGRLFEVDVIVIRGHRLYAVSCTTSEWGDTCKSKLFEVGHRSRQIGGDLARFAVACLLTDTGNANPGALEDDVKANWGASENSSSEPMPVRVFGLKHLKEWLGTDNREPDLYSLKQWLSS